MFRPFFKDDSKILFLILAEYKKIIGNFGITNITRDSAELDNLIRGEKGGDPKLIFYSELALINWIYNVLDIENIILHVMSSNIKTIVFHESVGFVGCNKINLMIKKHDNEIIYTKDLTRDPLEDEKYLLQMSINKKDFLKKYSWLT